jgi:putative ABC transport system ATP-binding protein
VVLADEPTGNLDSMNSSAVVALMLDQVRQHGTTLLLVTHDRELATRITSRIIALQDGAVVD